MYNKNKARVTALRQLLNNTDYQALKYSDKAISAEDYEPVRLQRQEWRREINVLEGDGNDE